jgi:membrane fusion protein (multidrug efflux system)
LDNHPNNQLAPSDKTERPVDDEARKPDENQPSDSRQVKDKDAGSDDSGSEENKPSVFRRHPLVILLIAIVIVLIGAACYFYWLVYVHPYETTDDAFVDARSFSVAAKVSGYVSDVPVTDNQHVNAGDVILKIDPRDYQIALDQAKSQIDVSNASIANADAQIAASKAAIDQQKAAQASSAAALQFAQDEANRQDQLLKTGAGSQQTQQQATATLRQDQANYAQAEASVTSAVKNEAAAEAQKASAIASLHQAQAQVETAEQNLRYTTITAAQPGRVVRLSGSKGQYIQAAQSVAMFVPDEVWVTANFKETQLTDMRPDQPVDVTIDAYPDHVLKGKVASVQPGSGTAFSLLPAENATGNYVKVTQRVPVKIVVDQWPADVSIGPGMSVVPSVTVRPRN